MTNVVSPIQVSARVNLNTATEISPFKPVAVILRNIQTTLQIIYEIDDEMKTNCQIYICDRVTSTIYICNG